MSTSIGTSFESLKKAFPLLSTVRAVKNWYRMSFNPPKWTQHWEVIAAYYTKGWMRMGSILLFIQKHLEPFCF